MTELVKFHQNFFIASDQSTGLLAMLVTRTQDDSIRLIDRIIEIQLGITMVQLGMKLNGSYQYFTNCFSTQTPSIRELVCNYSCVSFLFIFSSIFQNIYKELVRDFTGQVPRSLKCQKFDICSSFFCNLQFLKLKAHMRTGAWHLLLGHPWHPF